MIMGWFWRVCCWVVSVLLTLWLCMSLCNWFAYIKTWNWIEVDAQLLRVEIIDYEAQAVRLEPDESWDGSGHLVVEYEYHEDDVTYTGKEVSVEVFKHRTSRIVRFYELSDLLHDGGGVRVWVDPDKLAHSAVFRETHSDMFLSPALALFWFAALWFDRRRRLRHEGS